MLIFLSMDARPNYLALSEDIVDDRINGASNIGKTVFLTDTQE